MEDTKTCLKLPRAHRRDAPNVSRCGDNGVFQSRIIDTGQCECPISVGDAPIVNKIIVGDSGGEVKEHRVKCGVKCAVVGTTIGGSKGRRRGVHLATWWCFCTFFRWRRPFWWREGGKNKEECKIAPCWPGTLWGPHLQHTKNTNNTRPRRHCFRTNLRAPSCRAPPN